MVFFNFPRSYLISKGKPVFGSDLDSLVNNDNTFIKSKAINYKKSKVLFFDLKFKLLYFIDTLLLKDKKEFLVDSFDNKDFDNFIELNDNEEIKDKIDNKIDFKDIESINKNVLTKKDVEEIIENPTTKVTELKNNLKDEEKNLIFSPVIEFTSALPLDILNSSYSKIKEDLYLKPEKKITDEDLIYLSKNRPDIESLDISNCDFIHNFSIINRFENLKELNLNNCDYFNDLGSISGCKKLKVLNVGNTPIKNINAISNFKDLNIFNCSCNTINDINSIKYCNNLKELILWNCFSLSNINGVEGCPDLRVLDIDSTSVADIFPISNCKNLEFLFLDNCNRIDDIFALSALNKLKCLLFDSSNILIQEQVEALSYLLNLEILTLSGRKVIDLKPIRKLTKMKELILNGCNVNDLSPIEGMVSLSTLDLTANSNLRDLSPIHNMLKLKKVLFGGGGLVGGKVGSAKGTAISQMNIEDISVFKNLANLEKVDLNANSRLKDISFLKNCPKLEEVNFSKCTQLEDVSVLGELPNLRRINLTSCPKIKDLYFLRNLSEIESLEYNGTSVYTPGLSSVLRRCNSILSIKGNDSDILSQKMLVSSKKKVKLLKSFKKYFKNE